MDLPIVQKQMTPKLSHLKQLLSPGSGGWVGLGDFLMSGQGVGQSWGSCHLSMSGRSAGAVGQNTCMWPASWSGFLPTWRWVQAWMSPRYQAEAEWLFMTYPQEFRDSISDAQITGLYRFEERKPVSCFHKNMCEILWPSWKIHWFFESFYEKSSFFLAISAVYWMKHINSFINSSFRFAQFYILGC